MEEAWTNINKTRIFKFSPVQLQRIHPTQKPVALYKWLLKNYAKSGDKIFDSHLGSGSSRIACYELGFDFIGCELDKDYFEAQEKRFLEFKKRFDQDSFYTSEKHNFYMKQKNKNSKKNKIYYFKGY